jgi:hypothetical protein
MLKKLKTAPYGRGSESVPNVYSNILSRDHRERSVRRVFSTQSVRATITPMLLRGPKQQQIQTKRHSHSLDWFRSQWTVNRKQDVLNCGRVEIG